MVERSDFQKSRHVVTVLFMLALVTINATWLIPKYTTELLAVAFMSLAGVAVIFKITNNRVIVE